VTWPLPSRAKSSHRWAGLGFQDAAHPLAAAAAAAAAAVEAGRRVLGRDEWRRAREATVASTLVPQPAHMAPAQRRAPQLSPVATRRTLALRSREAHASRPILLAHAFKKSRGRVAQPLRHPCSSPTRSSKDRLGPPRTNSPLHHPSTLDAKTIGVAPRRCCPFGRAFPHPCPLPYQVSAPASNLHALTSPHLSNTTTARFTLRFPPPSQLTKASGSSVCLSLVCLFDPPFDFDDTPSGTTKVEPAALHL
jgi:hypothetical protein